MGRRHSADEMPRRARRSARPAIFVLAVLLAATPWTAAAVRDATSTSRLVVG